MLLLVLVLSETVLVLSETVLVLETIPCEQNDLGDLQAQLRKQRCTFVANEHEHEHGFRTCGSQLERVSNILVRASVWRAQRRS